MIMIQIFLPKDKVIKKKKKSIYSVHIYHISKADSFFLQDWLAVRGVGKLFVCFKMKTGRLGEQREWNLRGLKQSLKNSPQAV